MEALLLKILVNLAAENTTDLGLPRVQANSAQLKNVLNYVFIIVGALAVIFIIVGAFQYVTSTGEPNGTARAKNTILYAVIGLVIALFSLTIVNFVVGLF